MDYFKSYLNNWNLSYDKQSIQNWLGFRQPIILHDGNCKETLESLKFILGVMKYQDIREEILTKEKQTDLNNILSSSKVDCSDLAFPAFYVSVPDKNCMYFYFYFSSCSLKFH